MHLVKEDKDVVYIQCDKCGKLLSFPIKCLTSKDTNSVTFPAEFICPFCKNTNNSNTISYLPNHTTVPCPSNDQVHCPKCGSTQIQAVPRKWSLLTGFLTNKVDRVCLNCKHKF